MSKISAFVFPGQGSQHVGMLGDLASRYPLILDTFNRASEGLGYDLWVLAQEGPEQKLNQTHYTQPALLAAGVAIWNVWEKLNAPAPTFLAGHSLGEYTALVCAGVLDFVSAVKLVEQRGKFMQDAVPTGEGSMAAIIGLSELEVNSLCESASENGQVVSPANYNSVGQIVIAGATPAVDRALILAKGKSAKLAKKLSISVPSHCALMKPAAEQLAQELKAIPFKRPQRRVIHNVDVHCHEDPNAIRDALTRQLYSPVRWVGTIHFLLAQGVSCILEAGPGKVLTGLNKRIAEKVMVFAINQPESFQAALDSAGLVV